MGFRNLSDKEIEILKNQGCDCGDWNKILVKNGFSVKSIRDTTFKGSVRLGIYSEKNISLQNTEFEPGIYNSVISNCQIEDNVRIYNVNRLENYDVGENSLIENVNKICASENTNFGLGEKISVLNEAGGRELPLIPNMSSQIAYLIVNHKDNKNLQRKLDDLCRKEIENKSIVRGKIGKNSSIFNVKEISNVKIGPYSIIENSSLLRNGTIISEKDDPVKIGTNVICKNFMVLSGSSISDSAIIENCFVGQSVKIGKQYSAENSAFFANCELFHGEACSIFAGPFSVSHHKSSLLIAGYFSFYNAGSGTNQSNHMYKLGPVHQGYLERGSKTGSFSYLLFPSKVGAFSVVIGKHFNNFDSSDFPFSYINEEDGKSTITPALNLFSVGTKRDSDKWRKRDKRNSKLKLDNINFDLYSPFITSKMINASRILEKLYNSTPKEIKSVFYKGMKLPRLLMKSCKKYYDLGIDVAIGEQLLRKIEDQDFINIVNIINTNGNHDSSERESWIDFGGQFLSKSDLEVIIKSISNNDLSSIDELNDKFLKFHKGYDKIVWEWYRNLITEMYGDQFNNSSELIQVIIDKWFISKTKLLKMILKDAEKEFDSNSRISYGIDGDEEVKDSDFKNVRGSYEENAFVKEVNKEISDCEEIAKKIKSIINK